jgi:hypothetical protein
MRYLIEWMPDAAELRQTLAETPGKLLHTDPVSSVDQSPDGKSVASGSPPGASPSTPGSLEKALKGRCRASPGPWPWPPPAGPILTSLSLTRRSSGRRGNCSSYSTCHRRVRCTKSACRPSSFANRKGTSFPQTTHFISRSWLWAGNGGSNHHAVSHFDRKSLLVPRALARSLKPQASVSITAS